MHLLELCKFLDECELAGRDGVKDDYEAGDVVWKCPVLLQPLMPVIKGNV